MCRVQIWLQRGPDKESGRDASWHSGQKNKSSARSQQCPRRVGIGVILTLGFGRCAPDRSGWWHKAGRLGGILGHDSKQHHRLGRRRRCSRSFLLGRKGTCTVFKQSHEERGPQLSTLQPCTLWEQLQFPWITSFSWLSSAPPLLGSTSFPRLALAYSWST